MRVRLIVSLLLVAAVALFIFQNVGMIEIRFLAWSISMSRSLLLFVVLGAGILIGWLGRGVSAWRSRRRSGA